MLFQDVATDKRLRKRLGVFLKCMGKHAAQSLQVSPSNLASQVISIIMSKDLDDTEILQILVPLFDSNEIRPRHRASSRLTDIKEEIGVITQSNPPSTYLDIGCGNGEISAAIAKALRIEDSHGCDLPGTCFLEGGLIAFSECSPTRLPYRSNTFDLITMFMSAHHFENVDAMFRETRRVARPGSFLLMREHGVADAPYYDIMHALYSCTNFAARSTVVETTPVQFMAQYNRPEKYARYHAADEWVCIAKQHGFVLALNPRFKERDVLFDTVYMLFQLRKSVQVQKKKVKNKQTQPNAPALQAAADQDRC
jgi:SAM-dependent methyltransferase